MDCNLSTVLIKLSYVLYCTDEIIVRRCPSEIILTMHRESEFTIWWKRRCWNAPLNQLNHKTLKNQKSNISRPPRPMPTQHTPGTGRRYTQRQPFARAFHIHRYQFIALLACRSAILDVWQSARGNDLAGESVKCGGNNGAPF